MGSVGKAVSAPFKAIGGLFSEPDMPSMPTPEPTIPTPTVDQARINAEAEIKSDKRKGRLANYLSPSDTGAQLNQGTGPSLKRMLGA